MKLKFFDFETYPEWWCMVASDEEDEYLSGTYSFKFTPEEELKIKSKMRVYRSDRFNIDTFREEVRKGVLAGYNIKRFDLIIMACIFKGFTCAEVYIASQILIKKEKNETNFTYEEQLVANKMPKGYWAFTGPEAIQDLMDDSDKGLKDKEASFGMDIRETTIPFGKRNLTEAEKEEIIFYCKHDTFALHVQYVCISKPYIDTKLALGKTYGLSEKTCYESTNAKLVGKVLGAARQHGTQINDPTIKIHETPLREYIEKWVPSEALSHLTCPPRGYNARSKQEEWLYAKQVNIYENKVYMADGGIHSILTVPKIGRTQGVLYVEATETHGIFNIDLSGCHPSVMLYAGAMSRAVTLRDRFEDSVLTRRALKKKPKAEWTQDDQEKVKSFKLVHNVAFGAMGNKYLEMYDDYMRSKVCRVSQMIVIGVTNNVYTEIPEVKVIQTNTDGIMLYMKREYLDKLKQIIKHFEDLSNFEFEIEEDSRVWQLNVNNYIALDTKGKDKLKGKSFITSVWQPGYNKVRPLGNHIIARAQYAFYVKNENPIKFIVEHSKVDDFVLTCTKGPTFHAMVQKNRDGDKVLGKVARVIATNVHKYGQVRKQKWKNGILAEDLCANCPDHTWIVNDALYNYRIEGPINQRELIHKDGSRAVIDLAYYASLLDEVLNLYWYKLKNGRLELTHEFNLKGG